MLESFWSTWGADILACIVAAAGAISAVCATIRMFKSEKRMKQLEQETKESVQITQEGIVKAFKTAKINPDIKVSIAKQVDEVLKQWAVTFTDTVKKHEEVHTKLVLMVAKIMANTAAYNKLTEEEKAELERVMKEIVEDDGLVEVYLPTTKEE